MCQAHNYYSRVRFIPLVKLLKKVHAGAVCLRFKTHIPQVRIRHSTCTTAETKHTVNLDEKALKTH